jgi:hypothetical protein
MAGRRINLATPEQSLMLLKVIVLPSDSQYAWSNPPVHNFIDAAVYDRLQKLHLLPSNLANDESFLRRAYLDLAGRPPTNCLLATWRTASGRTSSAARLEPVCVPAKQSLNRHCPRHST